jgi:ribosomal protein S18 acetylase RimI-like enzyme
VKEIAERVLNKVTDIPKDSLYALRTRGLPEAIRILARETRSLFFNNVELVILACSLEGPIKVPEPRIPIRIRQGRPEDTNPLGDIVSPSYRRHYRRLFAREGSFCFVAIHQAEIIAFCWASTYVDPELHRARLQLEPWEAYPHDAYTAAEYRRMGVQSALIAHRNTWLRDQGYKRIIALVRTDNTASLTMLHKLGYQEVGRLRRQRILLWHRFYQRTTAGSTSRGSAPLSPPREQGGNGSSQVEYTPET